MATSGRASPAVTSRVWQVVAAVAVALLVALGLVPSAGATTTRALDQVVTYAYDSHPLASLFILVGGIETAVTARATTTVEKVKDWVAVRGSGPIHIITVMVR